MKVTLISDTHTKHRNCELDLPGGDLLIHAGDFMNSGYNPMEAIKTNVLGAENIVNAAIENGIQRVVFQL